MASDEARRLLGVRSDASLAEIREAHRRLIARVHPDAGGSAELATRVNAARDALVAEMNRRPPRAS
jgi:curved DNA-binding protein CbpA